mmetsp:Transcript_88448/g.222625  ORF Transcript_88448/g.222625 Transcript_88448/m.222625 type:complete len:219 (+) Transcript_88448:1618-2274(+)
MPAPVAAMHLVGVVPALTPGRGGAVAPAACTGTPAPRAERPMSHENQGGRGWDQPESPSCGASFWENKPRRTLTWHSRTVPARACDTAGASRGSLRNAIRIRARCLSRSSIGVLNATTPAMQRPTWPMVLRVACGRQADRRSSGSSSTSGVRSKSVLCNCAAQACRWTPRTSYSTGVGLRIPLMRLHRTAGRTCSRMPAPVSMPPGRQTARGSSSGAS